MAWVCTGATLPQFDGHFITQYCYPQYKMLTIALGWLFVVALFALAHGVAPGGTWLGAVLALLLIGVLPVALMVYVTLSRAQRRARRARRTPSGADPDGGGHAAADAVAPVREEP
jgi:hypothetical protein